MAYGIVSDRSTSREFVWEVCPNVDAKNVCQCPPPDALTDPAVPEHWTDDDIAKHRAWQAEELAAWKPVHEVFVYGAEPVQGHKKESWTPESWKQNAYDGLVAVLKSRDAVEAGSELAPLTGGVAWPGISSTSTCRAEWPRTDRIGSRA